MTASPAPPPVDHKTVLFLGGVAVVLSLKMHQNPLPSGFASWAERDMHHTSELSSEPLVAEYSCRILDECTTKQDEPRAPSWMEGRVHAGHHPDLRHDLHCRSIPTGTHRSQVRRNARRLLVNDWQQQGACAKREADCVPFSHVNVDFGTG